MYRVYHTFVGKETVMELKLKRVSQNLTLKGLSNLSGVGVNTILKLEKGNIDGVSVGILKKIANALNTTVVELFFSKEVK